MTPIMVLWERCMPKGEIALTSHIYQLLCIGLQAFLPDMFMETAYLVTVIMVVMYGLKFWWMTSGLLVIQ